MSWTHFLEQLDSAFHQRLGLAIAPFFIEKRSQVVKADPEIELISRSALPNSKRSFQEGFYFVVAGFSLVEERQVVQAHRRVGIVRPERLLPDCQRALIERLCIVEVTLLL